jgi:transcriptional regulator GlxA family with amidase domain
MYEGFEELDLVGPWEMATMWSAYADGPECLTVAPRRAPIRCARGMTVVPDHDFSTCPPLDYLLIPGGFATMQLLDDAAIIGFVRQTALHARHMLSVCTGAFMLEAAGLLDGRRATTHWKFLEVLRTRPGVTVVEERWVRDGNVWSSAGVSAGIDLLLAFIAAEAGEAAAGTVQFNAEYFPAAGVYGEAWRDPQAPAYLTARRDPAA